MKSLLTVTVILFSLAGQTKAACSDSNAGARNARDAVKALIALADTPDVVAYYGGAETGENGTTLYNIQPHFKFTKDWYKVSIRNSDCRVTSMILFLESLPIDFKLN